MASNYQDKYLKYKIKYLELKNNLKNEEITGGGIIKDWMPQFIKNEICHNDTLIISTGDISDVDGFIALAEYAKSGADVVFIMNYPAYLNNDSETIEVNDNGLGYSYNGKEAIYKTNGYNNIITEASNKVKALQLTENMSDDESDELIYIKKKAKELSSKVENLNYKKIQYSLIQNSTKYKQIIKKFNLDNKNINNDNLKKAFKHLAFYMINEVWNEVKVNKKGKIFFCDGGINEINPFHSTAIKNELLVYADSIKDTEKLFNDDIPDFNINNIKNYDNIYIDFNGSMAFLNSKWLKVLDSVKDNIKAVAIMGGVRDYEEPTTMSAIKDTINRFGYATMNQLYHPENTKKFFNFLKQNSNIKRYIVTNNLVNKLFPKITNDKDNKINKVINLNNNNEYLKQISKSFYESIFNVQPQPFDYFTALIINNLIYGNNIKKKKKINLILYIIISML
jgi:hypothetical protein